jgi:hypothetical protein
MVFSSRRSSLFAIARPLMEAGPRSPEDLPLQSIVRVGHLILNEKWCELKDKRPNLVRSTAGPAVLEPFVLIFKEEIEAALIDPLDKNTLTPRAGLSKKLRRQVENKVGIMNELRRGDRGVLELSPQTFRSVEVEPIRPSNISRIVMRFEATRLADLDTFQDPITERGQYSPVIHYETGFLLNGHEPGIPIGRLPTSIADYVMGPGHTVGQWLCAHIHEAIDDARNVMPLIAGPTQLLD